MIRLCQSCSTLMHRPAAFTASTSSAIGWTIRKRFFSRLKLLCVTDNRNQSIDRSAGPYATQYRKVYTISAQSLVAAAPSKWQPYLRLMRADKPIGTWLLYLPCTWSIALASPAGLLPDPYLLALFGVGAFFMRGAGCIVNDLWDKDFDRMVERTKSRPLASGELSTKQAVALLAGLLSTSLAILLQLNWCSVAVGAASLALVATYPLAKRYTYWPQVVLGLTFNWGCLLGWTAVQGDLASWAVPALYFGAINWTLVYDTIYAHQDKTDDIMIGVKSTALRFGDRTKYWLSGFSAAAISSIGLAGYLCHQTWPFYASLAITGTHLFWQVLTVNINDSADCWSKFCSNRWLGLILFLGISLGNYTKRSHDENVVIPQFIEQSNAEI